MPAISASSVQSVALIVLRLQTAFFVVLATSSEMTNCAILHASRCFSLILRPMSARHVRPTVPPVSLPPNAQDAQPDTF